MQNIETVFEIIAAASVVFGIITYFFDKARARRDATIQALEILFDTYNSNIKSFEKAKEYLKYRDFLGKVERLCISVESHVYSKKMVRRYGSKLLIMLYDDNKDYIIGKTRNDFKDENKFMSFERLVMEFKKEK